MSKDSYPRKCRGAGLLVGPTGTGVVLVFLKLEESAIEEERRRGADDSRVNGGRCETAQFVLTREMSSDRTRWGGESLADATETWKTAVAEGQDEEDKR